MVVLHPQHLKRLEESPNKLKVCALPCASRRIHHDAVSARSRPDAQDDAEVCGHDAEVCSHDAKVCSHDAEVSAAGAEVSASDVEASAARARTSGSSAARR